MNYCWICGKIADSEEHKFKASDLKRRFGKKMDALYIGKEIIEVKTYKNKALKFPKVICIDCNNNLSRPHDDAYDIFISYCFENHEQISKLKYLNFEEIYGNNWQIEKANLFRYYAKHAGCKIKTTYTDTDIADLADLADFIKGKKKLNDFIIRFELKEGIEAIMKTFNLTNKYNHLYNSETLGWEEDNLIKFGGWLTNNYISTNWVFGKKINSNADNILKNKYEVILMTNSDFFDIEKEKKGLGEYSKINAVDKFIIAFENGINKTSEEKIVFFNNLIYINNELK